MSQTTPLPDSEWSAPYSGGPPESLAPVVHETLALTDSLALGPAEGSAFAIPDRPRVISIFGSRGTGKSTALHFAAHALKGREGFMVLPVVDPETFAPGDSLGGWVLAAIERELTDSDRVKEMDLERGLTLEQMLENLRRAQAVRAATYLPGLENRGLSFEDFARDAVKIPAHGVRMAARLSDLLDALADARGASDLRLIVPVDDADLFPELLPSIVRDAQVLGASARVTVMFAADPKTLLQALQVAHISAHGEGVAVALSHDLLHPHEIRELAGRKLVKYFPRSHRVFLSPLSPEQRLGFTPLGGASDKTLGGVLSQFELPARPQSLADLFKIKAESGEEIAVSPYAKALSGNARDVRQLHEAISIVDPESPNASSRALALIVRHGLGDLEPDLPPRALEAISFEEVPLQERPAVRFDFRGLGFGKSQIAGLVIYRRPTEEKGPEDSEGTDVGSNQPLSRIVSLRPFDNDHSIVEQENILEEKISDGAQTDPEPTLPAQFTHLALLAWEAIQGKVETSLFEAKGYFSRLTLAGGSNWDGFVAGNSPEGEEWRYWVVPQWEEYSDYFTYRTGWNHMIEMARVGLEDFPRTDPTIVELTLLIHLDLVATVQLHKAVPDWIATLTPEKLHEIAHDWSDRCDGLRRRVESRLLEALSIAFEEVHVSQRATDFSNWFSRELPLSATPLLLPRLMCEWLIDFWKAHAPEGGRRECSERIVSRAREHILSYMADGDIALLEMISSEEEGGAASAAGLKYIRTQVSQRAAQRQMEALKLLEASGAPPELIAAVQEHGVTPEVVPALLNAGVKPELLTPLAEAFPPREAVEPDTKARPLLDTPGENEPPDVPR